MARGRTAADLGAFGVTPQMPTDAVMELLREYRAKRTVIVDEEDAFDTYVADLAGQRRANGAESLAGLAVEKRLAAGRGATKSW